MNVSTPLPVRGDDLRGPVPLAEAVEVVRQAYLDYGGDRGLNPYSLVFEKEGIA